MAADGTVSQSRARFSLGTWLIRASVALLFISSGLEKFGIGPGEEWVHIFAKIGIGDWFRYLTGALEAAGGLLLMIPFTAKAGAGLLILCMAGAIVCHVFVLSDPFSSIINVGLIVAIVAAARQPKPGDEKITTLKLR